MRRTAGNTCTDYKTNTQIANELKITRILDKLLEYKRNWIQHVNRIFRNRLPRVMKHYSSTGRRNHGRSLKRLLDTWDRNGSTSGPTAWQIYDDGGGGGGDRKVQTYRRVSRFGGTYPNTAVRSANTAVRSTNTDATNMLKFTTNLSISIHQNFACNVGACECIQ